MIVMSPYAKPAYISHVNHDFGSILKLLKRSLICHRSGTRMRTPSTISLTSSVPATPNVFQPITPPPNDASCKADTSPATDPDDD